jgi:adenosylcobinamide-GDP ribazoletransferase
MQRDSLWWLPPLLAVQFLTRIAIPGTQRLSPAIVSAALVRAVVWFPLVGTLIGCVTAGVALVAAGIWSVPVAVVLALIVEMRLTGAFHEDAVADFCDGFGGGRNADDILRIMKDSRIGSYGSTGLILGLALRGALLIGVIETLSPFQAAFIIIAAATFGRLTIITIMSGIAPVSSGLARDVGAGTGVRQLVAAIITSVPGLLLFAFAMPWAFLASIICAGLFCIWFKSLLLKRLGGSSGDCLGFSAYAGQIILLLCASYGLS